MFIKKLFSKSKKHLFLNTSKCFSKSFNVGLNSRICSCLQFVAVWCFEVYEEIWPHINTYLEKNILIDSDNCGYFSDTYQNFRIGSFLKVNWSLKSETYSNFVLLRKIYLIYLAVWMDFYSYMTVTCIAHLEKIVSSNYAVL